MDLPFPVQTVIYEKFNLSWHDGNIRLVYICFKDAVENYSEQTDKDGFEVLQDYYKLVYQ